MSPTSSTNGRLSVTYNATLKHADIYIRDTVTLYLRRASGNRYAKTQSPLEHYAYPSKHPPPSGIENLAGRRTGWHWLVPRTPAASPILPTCASGWAAHTRPRTRRSASAGAAAAAAAAGTGDARDNHLGSASARTPPRPPAHAVRIHTVCRQPHAAAGAGGQVILSLTGGPSSQRSGSVTEDGGPPPGQGLEPSLVHVQSWQPRHGVSGEEALAGAVRE